MFSRCFFNGYYFDNIRVFIHEIDISTMLVRNCALIPFLKKIPLGNFFYLFSFICCGVDRKKAISFSLSKMPMSNALETKKKCFIKYQWYARKCLFDCEGGESEKIKLCISKILPYLVVATSHTITGCTQKHNRKKCFLYLFRFVESRIHNYNQFLIEIKLFSPFLNNFFTFRYSLIFFNILYLLWLIY